MGTGRDEPSALDMGDSFLVGVSGFRVKREGCC